MDRSIGIGDLRVIGEYQFGPGAGQALFPSDDSVSINRSRSGRPRQILAEPGRIVTFTTTGWFTLGIEGGRRLHHELSPPRYRVVVGTESEPFVRDGQNVFAKFVRSVDELIRLGDEVLVVNETGSFLGVGRAELSADGMIDFETGMAVKVRHGTG